LVLGEEEILSADLLSNLVNMAKFRNLIVHDYASIDDQIVFSILQRRLDDLVPFAYAVTRHFES